LLQVLRFFAALKFLRSWKNHAFIWRKVSIRHVGRQKGEETKLSDGSRRSFARPGRKTGAMINDPKLPAIHET
jgi:hypothetical protein